MKFTELLMICSDLPSSLICLLYTILTGLHAKCVASFTIKAGISHCDTAAFTEKGLSSHTINAIISGVEQLENLLLPSGMHDFISKKCSLGLIYFDRQPLDSVVIDLFPVLLQDVYKKCNYNK